MQHIKTSLRKRPLRTIATAGFLCLIALVSFSIGGAIAPVAAYAAPITPAARSYQVDRGNPNLNHSYENQRQDGNGLVDSIQEGAETVKEKLNLDEPLPESTKLFFKQLKGEDVEFKDPVPSHDVREPQNE